ncbi:acyltransferase [Aestuariibacter salexigens]|uniref:acyltransferase n=1 Tax=Aestuariibacter salexigens TaxID=226010 RepID=UPI001F0A732F|nr:hypothetical protein [Aestuariibacter salexigens]
MTNKNIPNFKGLTIDDQGENNEILIDDECVFNRSKIVIAGNNNKVTLGATLSYNQLVINLKGNKKRISIGNSNKHINNLKLVSIRGNHQIITIGRNLSCGGMEVQMNDGNESLTIGKDCLFSWGIKARTSDGHSIIDIDSDTPINFPQDISIGDHVWISEDVRLMKGAIIPSDCVIGAGAIVTKKFDETNSVIAGVPAKVVKRNIKWDHRQPSKYKPQ